MMNTVVYFEDSNGRLKEVVIDPTEGGPETVEAGETKLRNEVGSKADSYKLLGWE